MYGKILSIMSTETTLSLVASMFRVRKSIVALVGAGQLKLANVQYLMKGSFGCFLRFAESIPNTMEAQL